MDSPLIVHDMADLEFAANTCNHILTLFSGGLDSSYLLYRLSQTHCKVTALTVDLGDGVDRDDLKTITDYFGADLVVLDARNRFIDDAVIPAVQAFAQYLGIYPISSSLSRPIIVQCAVEQVKKLGCGAIIHTANQSQNSLRRLNGALQQLGYEGFYGTPYEFSVISRQQKMEELARVGLARFQARGISGDANLWVREYESGSLDNPEDFTPPEALFTWTAKVPETELGEQPLSIRFEKGVPVAVNDETLPTDELISVLNYKVGRYGIGRFSGLEHLQDGEKVLEVREAPAASILMSAWRHLETATQDVSLLRHKMTLEQAWVNEAIEGRWFGPLRLCANAFIHETARQVSGCVSFRLQPGRADLVSIVADHPLYLTNRDQWEQEIAVARRYPGLEYTVNTANQPQGKL